MDQSVEQLRRKERELAQEIAQVRAAMAATEPAVAQDPEGTSSTFDDTALYGAILRSATDYAIIAADLEGSIVEWNVGARDLLGWSQDDIIGQSIHIIFTPEDRENGVPDREMRNALETGHAIDERWHLRRDGSRFFADGRMMPLKSHAGQICGYLKILRDKTGQMKSERLVLAQKNVLRTVTDHIDAAILQVDRDNEVIFINPSVERLFGWSPAEIHGRPLHETLHHHGPDGCPYAKQDCPLFAVLETGETIRDFETVFFKRDGGPVDVSCSNSPILVDGIVVGAVMAVHDISKRKQAEEAIRGEVRRYEAIEDIRRAVEASAGDLDAVLAAVVVGAARVLPQTKSAGVEMVDGDACVYRAVSDPAAGEVGWRVDLANSFSGASLALGLPLICDDTETDDRLNRERSRLYGVRSMLVVPIPRHGLFVGVLKLTAPVPSAFGPRDVVVAQVLVGHIATGFAQNDERRALRNMKQSEERLQLALHASETIGIWDWDVENDVCYADSRFARLFGVDPVEAADGLPMADFAAGIHPDDRVWVATAARHAMAEAGDYAMEHRVRLADGSIRWVSARGRSYNGADGRPQRFPGAVVDITERKRVEASLHNAETNARLAVRAAGLGLWDYDPVADRMIWDERCRAIFGLASEAIPTLDIVMNGVHPRSRDALRATVQAATASGRLVDQAHEFEIVRCDDGEARWVEVSAQAFFAEDRCNRIIGTIGDITERKRLEAALREDEQRFRTMAESIPQLAWMASPSGDIFWFNERWFDYTGTSFADLRGQGWQVVHHPDTLEAVVERMQAAFKDGIPWDDTLLLRGRDGRFRWFLSRALPMRDDSGAILRWFGTHTDIDDQIRARDAQARFGEDMERQVAARTAELSEINARLVAEMADRRRAEEALLQSQKMEAVGQLTGGIAHDFNNLLTGITGSLDLMRKRISQGRVGELDRYMTAAATSASRAAALTHRLLAFARRQPLDARQVDANALVASMEDLFHRTLGETIEIELRLAHDLWSTLCDPHQLENALLNLVINARDAMPDGGHLTIETGNLQMTEADMQTEADHRPGEYITLQVSDTGVGMSADVLARVFEPFYTTKPIGQGTGLGLSMIYGFARQSHGQISVRSTEGQGTVFTLLLPRFQGQEDGSEAERLPQVLDPADGETVLVVEDDPVVRGLVLDVLRELGYETLEAHDGLSGLAALQGRGRIDLVVTDVGLPGLNGRQLAEMGRASRPDLKVLFITGYAENAAFGEGVLDKSMQMITKPFAIDALAAKIRDMIKR